MIRRPPKRHPLIAASRTALFVGGVALYASLALGAVLVASAVFVPPVLVVVHVIGRRL